MLSWFYTTYKSKSSNYRVIAFSNNFLQVEKDGYSNWGQRGDGRGRGNDDYGTPCALMGLTP